ncbi:Dimeric alpha+beta barrel [Glarea lozoyensis ATCC 20868]|uniref:Dimeric alpha+beta barrel n=1 Tax=Glarea lozoyensis (strain ATCC 20868 / MF5171) TaxID=1116229 RepID=S3DHE2_GLAL2|nr:Dimeric alpha+beta barrel [Glarea lozoyensis ATCC 20868]EPE37120.1 Dimeric alpha+beta barrel [Glarea lozoyensis ATCC 20868]
MSSPPQGPRLKYSITHYRKPGRSHDDFINWIVKTHLPKALPVFKKHGILGYSLFVTPAALNIDLKPQFATLRPTWEFAEFDCFIEYIIPSFECVKAVMMDAEWAEAVADQEEWVDVPRALVSMGFVTAYLEEGREVGELKS